MMRTTRGIFSVMVMTFLVACSVKVDSPKIDLPEIKVPEVKLDIDVNQVTCSAMLAPAAGGYAVSGIAAPISVMAKGGVAPYEIVDTAIAFDSETVLARTYTNNGTAAAVQVDTVVVKDAVGLVSQCNFLVSVLPAGTPPPVNPLACTMTATPANPLVNQNVVFGATASGGTAPYVFSQLTLGTDGSVVSPLSYSGANATATAKYSSAGLRGASIVLSDATTSIVCAKQVNVQALASVSVVASPATSVAAGATITLTATPAAFSSTPTYSFATSRGGVSISWTSNVATVTSNSTQTPFDVVVTATNGSQVATSTISLSFSPPSSLACSISHPAGVLYVTENVPFSVVAANGQALEITYFATHSDGVVTSQTDASRTVKYSVPGIKTVLMQAKAKSNGALCNAGGVLSDQVEITASPVSPLTCTGSTSYNPSYTNEWFYASAAISGGQGEKWVSEISIKNGGNPFFSYDGTWYDADTAQLRIPYAGTYEIKFHIKDNYGHTGSCTTTHLVRNWW